MISRNIIHELAHAVSKEPGAKYPTIVDHKTAAGLKAYGWFNVIRLDGASGSTNAESYVYLAFWAGLADAGFTLPRLDGLTKDTEPYKATVEKMRKGIMTRYEKITSRMLQSIAFSA
jgi:hypothetical protein